MKEYLAYTDVVAYLTSVNGNIRSIYVDKEKAMNIGCSFQDKILDYKVLPDLQRLQELSAARAQEKYPSEKDVQKILKKLWRCRIYLLNINMMVVMPGPYYGTAI